MRSVVDVIIVNWNSGSQLRECVDSLARATASAFEFGRIVIIDNASYDGSAYGVSVPSLPILVTHNSANRGFGAACNQGAVGSTADYLLFLNPDTRVLADSIDRVASWMGRPDRASTGICSIQLVDSEGHVSRSCARLPTPRLLLAYALGLDRVLPRFFPSHFMTEWDHASSREVDHVIGAFYAVRRSLFEQLGGFDERFFMYLEDVDFSARARNLGYRCWYLADAQAFHKGGGTSEQIKASRLFYSMQSRLLYSYKHFNAISASFVALITMVAEPVVRCGFALGRGAGSELAQTARAYALLWRRAPGIFRAGVSAKRTTARLH